jgi:hypothetical protein
MMLLWAPDRMIGIERAVPSLCFGDAGCLKCNAGLLLSRAAASPVDDQRGTQAMMWEIVLALMRYRS